MLKNKAIESKNTQEYMNYTVHPIGATSHDTEEEEYKRFIGVVSAINVHIISLGSTLYNM